MKSFDQLLPNTSALSTRSVLLNVPVAQAAIVLGCFTLGSAAFAAEPGEAHKVDLSKLPPASTKTGLTYAMDNRLILEKSCFGCHGEERQRGKLRVDSLEALMKGSEEGPVLVTGKSLESRMVVAVAQIDDESAMPPKRRPGGRGGPGGPGGGRGPSGGGEGEGVVLAVRAGRGCRTVRAGQPAQRHLLLGADPGMVGRDDRAVPVDQGDLGVVGDLVLLRVRSRRNKLACSAPGSIKGPSSAWLLGARSRVGWVGLSGLQGYVGQKPLRVGAALA